MQGHPPGSHTARCLGTPASGARGSSAAGLQAAGLRSSRRRYRPPLARLLPLYSYGCRRRAYPREPGAQFLGVVQQVSLSLGQQAATVEDREGKLQPNPWLRRVGWAVHLAGQDISQIRRTVSLTVTEGWPPQQEGARQQQAGAGPSRGRRGRAGGKGFTAARRRLLLTPCSPAPLDPSTSASVGERRPYDPHCPRTLRLGLCRLGRPLRGQPEGSQREAAQAVRCPARGPYDRAVYQPLEAGRRLPLPYLLLGRGEGADEEGGGEAGSAGFVRPPFRLTEGRRAAFLAFRAAPLPSARGRLVVLPPAEAGGGGRRLLTGHALTSSLPFSTTPLPGSSYDSVLLSALAAVGIRDDGGWASPDSYTGHYSAIIKVARMLVVRQAFLEADNTGMHSETNPTPSPGLPLLPPSRSCPSLFLFLICFSVRQIPLAARGSSRSSGPRSGASSRQSMPTGSRPRSTGSSRAGRTASGSSTRPR